MILFSIIIKLIKSDIYGRHISKTGNPPSSEKSRKTNQE